MRRILICVAGGSGAGKTTVIKEIVKALDNKVTIVNHDDYYKSFSDLSLSERKKLNYDHPDALDNDLLISHLEKLLEGKSVVMPRYDFIKHMRLTVKEVVKPSNVIILEGILALDDPRIRKLADIKLYVESDDDTRFIRRLMRDMKERGRTVEEVVEQYVETVKPMFYSYVKPSKRYADIIIPNDQKHDVAVDVIVAKIKSILEE